MGNIIDQFGRPIEKTPAPPVADQDVAYTQVIRDRYRDYPSQNLTPGKLSAILKQADIGWMWELAQLIEEMEEKDLELAGHLQTRKLSVVGLDWEILPGDSSAVGIKAADFCAEVFDALPAWEENQLDLLDATPKGYSMMDLKWANDGRDAVISDLEHVPPKLITWYDSLTPRILQGDSLSEYIDPPPFRTVFHRSKARSGYTPRLGLGRSIAWMYLFRNWALKDWAAFVEVFAVPLRLGTYPAGATDDEKKALMRAVAGIGTDAAAIISEATKIEFPEVRKDGTVNVFDSFMAWTGKQFAFAILGQLATSQSVSTGLGSSVGKEQGNVRQDILEADAKALQNTITQQILRPLAGFTFGFDAPCPRYKIFYEPANNYEELGKKFVALQNLGFPLSKQRVAEAFDEEIPGPDDDILEPSTKPIVDPFRPLGTASGPERVAGGVAPAPGVVSPPGDAVAADQIMKDNSVADGAPGMADPASPVTTAQAIADRAGSEAGPALGTMIAPIRALLESATSLDDFRDKLLAWGQTQDPAALKGFGELVQKMMMAAELSGRYSVQENAPGVVANNA